MTAGTVDLLGNGFYDYYPGNGLYIDLNGTSSTSGTLTSKALFDPGTYDLTFVIGNNGATGPANSVSVSLGDYSEDFSRVGYPPLETVERSVTVTSASRLVFATPPTDSDQHGIIIDGVSVTLVPEPCTLALLCIAALGLLWYRRR